MKGVACEYGANSMSNLGLAQINAISSPLYQGGGEIPGIMLLKFLCALLVVQIHVGSCVHEQLMPLARLAVPLFFMITGYFLLDAEGKLQKHRIKRSFVKILRITIVAYVVYSVASIAISYFNPELHQRWFPNPQFYWIHYFFIGSVPGWHLWYLIALLQALVVLYLVADWKFSWLLLLIIPIGLTMKLLLGKYSFLIGDVQIPGYIPIAFLNMALPCLLIGMLIRYFEQYMPSIGKLAIAGILFLALTYVEDFCIRKFTPYNENGSLYIFTIISAICIFICCLRMDLRTKAGKKMAEWGKLYSSDIYVWHILVAIIFWDIIEALHFGAFAAFIVMGLSLLLAMGIKLVNLKRIYNRIPKFK